MKSSRAVCGRAFAAVGLLAGSSLVATIGCDGQERAVAPVECTGNPHQQPDCLFAISKVCERYTRAECEAAPIFDTAGDGFACGWAEVVSIPDPQTCEVAMVEGLCVATGYVGEIGCSPSCPGGDEGAYGLLYAFPSAGKLIRPACDEGWIGPVDAPVDVALCGDGGTEDQPPICDCAPEACGAL